MNNKVFKVPTIPNATFLDIIFYILSAFVDILAFFMQIFIALQWYTQVSDTVKLELLAEVSTDSHTIRGGSLTIFQEQDGICELLIVHI